MHKELRFIVFLAALAMDSLLLDSALSLDFPSLAFHHSSAALSLSRRAATILNPWRFRNSHSSRIESQNLVCNRGKLRAWREVEPAIVDKACESWESWLLDEWEGSGNPERLSALSKLGLRSLRDPEMKEINPNRVFWRMPSSITPAQFAQRNHSIVAGAVGGLQGICDMQKILVLIGRALVILGVGLSLSTPAMAKPVASQAKEASAANSQTVKMREDEVAQELEQKAENAVSQISEESEGRLSAQFWNGIPTAEGSRMHVLKLRLDSHPNDFRALEALLHAVMEQRDMLRALTVLEKLVELQPDELNWKFMKARTHECLGELSMAMQGFEELLVLRPLSARVLQELIMLLNRRGQGEKALQLIEKALSRAITENKDIEASNLRILLGQYYTQKGKFEEALKQYNMMIDQDPNDFRPHLCEGLVYSLMGENDKANQHLEKYRQLCPVDFQDRSYLDDLMFKAKGVSIKDELSQKASKNASKGKTKPKAMKQPSIIGKNTLNVEESAENLEE